MEIPSGCSCSMRGLCQQKGERLQNPHTRPPCEPEVGTAAGGWGLGMPRALPGLPPACGPLAHRPCNQPPARASSACPGAAEIPNAGSCPSQVFGSSGSSLQLL